jgi:uncharacterized protein (DUF849 family)
MITTDKLIVCAAICGSFLGKEANPNIPTSPEEIAEEAYRSWNEGAAMAHIHARNKDGLATTDPEVFNEITRLIRGRNCDIVLEFSTSPGREEGASIEDGFRVLEANPELVSFNVGVAVFMRAGKEEIDYDPRNRPWFLEAQGKGVGKISWTDPYLFFTAGKSSQFFWAAILGSALRTIYITAGEFWPRATPSTLPE